MQEKEMKQIEKFVFYEFYYELMKGLKDEEVGQMMRVICEFVFDDIVDVDIQDDKLRFLFGNIIEMLEQSKEVEKSGKSIRVARGEKYFMFVKNFYDAIKLMDIRQCGQYVKAICRYMFEDSLVAVKSPVDMYFRLAKRKLDLSKKRKFIGKKGGDSPKIKVTNEDINASHSDCIELGIEEFLKRYPHIKNDLYNSNRALLNGVNWSLLDMGLKNNVRFRKCESLFQILKNYKEIVRNAV